jgi:hypothetical protein
VNSVVTVSLPPNRTHAVRSATFIRVSARPLIGVVEIREQRSERSKAKSSRYALRDDSDGEYTGRMFRLTKPGGRERYWTILSCKGDEYDSCTCRGFEAFGVCKHIHALRGLLEEGHLNEE